MGYLNSAGRLRVASQCNTDKKVVLSYRTFFNVLRVIEPVTIFQSNIMHIDSSVKIVLH